MRQPAWPVRRHARSMGTANRGGIGAAPHTRRARMPTLRGRRQRALKGELSVADRKSGPRLWWLD
eukprot:6180706-Pleurochrysis_carterae.AAC.2